MRTTLTLLLFLELSACGRPPASRELVFHDKPPMSVIRKIEARVGQEQCIGSLDRWSRHYSYQAAHAQLDKQSVTIGYALAGEDGVPAGIFRETPDVYRDTKTGQIFMELKIDDRPKKNAASGIYDMRRNAIGYWGCGPTDRPIPEGYFPLSTLYMAG